LAATAALLPAALWLAVSWAQDEPQDLAPFYATPRVIAEKMLELGGLHPGELHYDLGSGDGRIVIMAAGKFGARSVGFEIDRKLVARSRARILELGLQPRARIEARDLMKADFSKPDLITVYLMPSAMENLGPRLQRQMHPGSRVVSHYFPFPDWRPAQKVNIPVRSPNGQGRLYPLYLYTPHAE